MKSLVVFGAIIVLAAPLSGCPRERYTLRLEVDEHELKRELTVEGLEEKKIPKADLRALKKIYRAKPRKLDKQKYRFVGTFRGSTPDDIGGGNGSLHVVSSSLGEAFSYIETFRGDDDPAAQLEARLAAVDQLIKIGRGWLKYELGSKAGFERLDKFIATTGRNDLRALMIYSWLEANAAAESGDLFPPELPGSGSAGSEEAGLADGIRAYRELRSDGMDVRMLQFAIARGYGTSTSLHKLDEAALFHRVLVDKAGIKNPKELVAWARELFDGDKKPFEVSFENYIRTTHEFRGFAKGRKKGANNNEVVGDYLVTLEIFDFLTFSPSQDELAVGLVTDVEPAETNGRWDAASGTVRWEGWIAGRNDKGEPYLHLPDLCHASWALPNTAAQRKQFGKVVLERAELFDYTNFYNVLSDVHREQWDRFLAGLNASNIDRLLDFTFDGDDKPAVHAHLPFALFYKAVSGKPVPEPPESETPPAKGKS